MPPRSAAAPSSCGQTDKRTPALTTAPSPSTWGGIGAGGAGGGKRQRETHAPKREKRRTNLAPRGHTPARSAGAGGKGGLWFGRREEGARETETEGQKDRGGEGRQRHWKKRNTASERKTEGGGEGGRKCRKRRERNITPCPFSGRKGRGGNKSPTVFFPPPFWFWWGTCRAEVGCFSNLPCLSAIPAPSLPPHTYTQKPGGGVCARGIRAGRELSGGASSPFQHIFTPAGTASVYTPQIHLYSV